jgi:serine protease Do
VEYNGFKRRRRSMTSYFVTAVLGSVLGCALMLLFAPSFLFSKITQNPTPVAHTQTVGFLENTTTVPAATLRVTDIGIAASKVMPAVVGILRPIVKKTKSGTQNMAEVGTGVIVDPGGYILTNNHVADASKDLDISLYDGRNITGRVVWADPILDISMVKVNAKDLAYAKLGNSKNVKIGDNAIAIGNPLGLKFQRSVTSGIISALNRTVQMDANTFMEDLLQTDASINPGNSGGPLINIDGEVIGINTVKVATAEGMGFAIPINMAKPIIESFKKTGTFKTPALGIEGVDIAMAAYFEYKVDKGVYVYNVIGGSPAYKAGIKVGESIVSVNGVDINTLMDLKESIFRIGIGGTAILTLETPINTTRNVTVKLEQI